MNFQIVNTPTPNAVHNTCVFSCFEAGDSVTNLHVSLDRYKDDIKDLQGMMWKYVLYYLLYVWLKVKLTCFQMSQAKSLPLWRL